MKKNTLLTLGIEENTPLAMMTLGQLVNVIRDIQDQTPVKQQEGKEFVYGLRGIQQLFGIAHKTAQAWKNTWLAPACDQVGRTIIVDKEEALRLFKERGRGQNE